MFKISKLSALLMFGALTVGATSCVGGEKYDLQFWHNFGTNYTDYLTESFITPLKELEEPISVGATSKGSYDNLKAELSKTIASATYPNMATGYPDHFAAYARIGYPRSATGILADLTKYMDDSSAISQAHKAKYGYTLKEDFYAEYMVENTEICYDTNDNKLTVGLPFNKSTEVMGYNGIFVDYVKAEEAKASRVIDVPKTWGEWKLYGPTFRQYQMGLNGKYLCGDLDADGTGSNFYVSTDSTDAKVLLDFTKATNANSAVLSWDSLANMFITLVRQYGSQFTSYTDVDRHQVKIADRHGYMEFYTGVENKTRTTAAMQMVRDLAGSATDGSDRVFRQPAFFSEGASGSYSSDAFAANKVMFTICSTGGLTYNLKNDGQRFRIAPIPYFDAAHKYVISQGANLTIFNRASVDKPELGLKKTIDMAFETVVKMTTGDYQATWASLTGYYPASRSATESEIYQSFLNGHEEADDPEFATKRAYREGAKLNNDEYMNEAKGWTKFVDPGFVGSAEIRARVDFIIGTLIDSPLDSIDTILTNVYNDANVSKYARK